MRLILTSLLLISSSILCNASPQPSPSEAPAVGKPIPNQYIVVLKPSLPSDKVAAHKKWATGKFTKSASFSNDSNPEPNHGIHKEFGINSFNGYVGTFDDSSLSEIKENPDVEYVEKDTLAQAGYSYAKDWGKKYCPPPKKYGDYYSHWWTYPRGLITQKNVPSWGLARISQACKPIDFTKYYYHKSAGKGTTAYVIDTGVRTTHTTFGGRASFGASFSPDGADDGHGHGTHVAGTIAGKEYGVAKKANIIAVKVLDNNGFGAWSQIIAGIEWAANHAAAAGKSKKSVANMSIWGPHTQAVDDAVKAAVNSGLTMVVIAGNAGADTSGYSPGSEPSAITVGATESTDARWSGSNYGTVVDIFAPGVDITSAYNTDDTATTVMTGTSMAAPHVAGVACYLIAKDGVRGPQQVTDRLLKLADFGGGVVTDPGPGTTTRLLYNGAH